MTAPTARSAWFRYQKDSKVQIGSASAYFQTLALTASATRTTGAVVDSSDSDFAAALTAATSTDPTTATGTVGSASSASDEDRYAPRSDQDLSYLTPDDRRMIKAATGYEISSDGVVQNPTPGQAVDPFISILASERREGNISGSSVTPDYLQKLFAQYGNNPQNPNSSFNPAYLDRALNYLAQQDKQRTDGTTRSSFTVGA